MGLSNGERYSKIVYAINALTKIENVQNKLLRKYIKSLWYHFLKNESKGLFGNDLGDVNIEEGTFVGTAFMNHIPEKEYDPFPSEGYRYFDYYQTASRMLDMQHILSNSDRNAGNVLLIFQWTETIIYALCRYNDDFKDRYKSLNFVVRQIQGECFDNFKSDRIYPSAWMLANLVEKVLTSEEDVVNKWWMKQHLHHNVRIENLKYEKLFNVYKRFQFVEPSIEERIILTLRLMGNKYNTDHNKKDFLEMIKDMQFCKRVEKYLSNLKPEKYEFDFKYCEFTGNSQKRSDYNG